MNKLPDCKRGTEVRLHLRDGALGKTPEESVRRLASYVRGVLLRVPCRFVLSAVHSESDCFDLSPGWVRSNEYFSEELMEELFKAEGSDENLEILPALRRKQRESAARFREEVRSEAHQLLKWKTGEGALPNGVGRYRFHLPHFLLHGGAALAYMRVRDVAKSLLVEKVEDKHVFWNHESRATWRFGWNGIEVRPGRSREMDSAMFSLRNLRLGYPEIDLAGMESGAVGVSRAEVQLSHKALGALWWLNRRVGEIAERFLDEHDKSIYATLNSRIAAPGSLRKSPPRWLTTQVNFEDEHRRWSRLEVPLINEESIGVIKDRVEKFSIKFRGKNVCVASPLQQ